VIAEMTLQKKLKKVNTQLKDNGNPATPYLLINGFKCNYDSILLMVGGLVSGILVKVI